MMDEWKANAEFSQSTINTHAINCFLTAQWHLSATPR